MKPVCEVLLFVLACFGAEGAQTLERTPFVIAYEPRDAEVAKRALDILERSAAEWEGLLEVGADPIRVIIAGDVPTFHRHAGSYALADVSGIAKPSAGLIVVKAPRLLRGSSDFTGVLRHELVHVLLERTVTPEHLPRWLNEGIAMVLSGENRWNSIFRVAEMRLYGDYIPYRQLDLYFAQPGAEGNFSDAYAQSVRMTHYLRETLGASEFEALIGDMKNKHFGAALHDRLGVYPHAFYERWVQSLWWPGVVFWIVSGGAVFQIMALLALWAYWRYRRKAARMKARWDHEDRGMAAAGAGGALFVDSWDREDGYEPPIALEDDEEADFDYDPGDPFAWYYDEDEGDEEEDGR